MGTCTIIDDIQPVPPTQIARLRPLVLSHLDVTNTRPSLHLDGPLFTTRADGEQIEPWALGESSGSSQGRRRDVLHPGTVGFLVRPGYAHGDGLDLGIM